MTLRTTAILGIALLSVLPVALSFFAVVPTILLRARPLAGERLARSLLRRDRGAQEKRQCPLTARCDCGAPDCSCG